jgi:endonuclease YncB( thermonuclease family)
MSVALLTEDVDEDESVNLVRVAEGWMAVAVDDHDMVENAEAFPTMAARQKKSLGIMIMIMIIYLLWNG